MAQKKSTLTGRVALQIAQQFWQRKIWCQSGTGPRLKNKKLFSSIAILSGLRFPSKEPVWSGWALPRFCQRFNFVVQKPPLILSHHFDGRHRDKQLVSAVKVLQCQWATWAPPPLYTHRHTERTSFSFAPWLFFFQFHQFSFSRLVSKVLWLAFKALIWCVEESGWRIDLPCKCREEGSF